MILYDVNIYGRYMFSYKYETVRKEDHNAVDLKSIQFNVIRDGRQRHELWDREDWDASEGAE